MTSYIRPFLCTYCKHLHRFTDDPLKLTCEAFPDGIPGEVLSNQADHRAPIDGDHGITFDQLRPTLIPPVEDMFG